MPRPESVVPCYIVCHCCVSVNTGEVDQGKAIWIIGVQTGHDSVSKTNSTFCFLNCRDIGHRSIYSAICVSGWLMDRITAHCEPSSGRPRELNVPGQRH